MNIKINLFNKNEKYNLRLYNKIQMNYKLINNEISFNFNNLNIYDKNDNVINIIKLNLFKYNYKQSIHFKYY